MDVAACRVFPVAWRRDLLEGWKGDEEALQRAQNEGMNATVEGCGHPNADSADSLQAIGQALATLLDEEPFAS